MTYQTARERVILSSKNHLTILLLLATAFVVSSGLRANANQGSVEASIDRLNSPVKEQRIAAVKHLAAVKSVRATEGLVTALDNADREVREIAVDGLTARINNEDAGARAVEGLVHALDNSASPVRRKAVSGLSNSSSERATEGLIHGLDNSDETVARSAVDSLAKRARGSESSERAIEGLIHALDNEQFEVRKIAVMALRDAHTNRSREGLKHALNDSDERIRQIAKEALHQ